MSHLRASSRTSMRAGAAVAVLGAGGAARGIVYAFLEAGAPEVRIFNRTRERADAVAAPFRRPREGLRLGRARRSLARGSGAGQRHLARHGARGGRSTCARAV